MVQHTHSASINPAKHSSQSFQSQTGRRDKQKRKKVNTQMSMAFSPPIDPLYGTNYLKHEEFKQLDDEH